MWLLPGKDLRVEKRFCQDTHCFPLIRWTFSRIFKIQHKLGMSWGNRMHCSSWKTLGWLRIRNPQRGRFLPGKVTVWVWALGRDFCLVTHAWERPGPSAPVYRKTDDQKPFSVAQPRHTGEEDTSQEAPSRPVFELGRAAGARALWASTPELPAQESGATALWNRGGPLRWKRATY